MPWERVELSRLAAPGPKPGVSTSSTTKANSEHILNSSHFVRQGAIVFVFPVMGGCFAVGFFVPVDVDIEKEGVSFFFHIDVKSGKSGSSQRADEGDFAIGNLLLKSISEPPHEIHGILFRIFYDNAHTRQVNSVPVFL